MKGEYYMSDNIYWIYDENNVNSPFERKLLVIGQSGSGKTTLARYLCKKNPETFEIIKNCTTRLKREEDRDDFRYFSVNEFMRAKEKGEFFFARFGSKPLYGYKKTDYEEIVSNKKIPIFMFRFSGLKYLKNLMKNYFVIFLISDLNESLSYSKDEDSLNLIVESTSISKEIKNTIREFDREGERYIVIRNNYKEDFFAQIDKIRIEDVWI